MFTARTSAHDGPHDHGDDDHAKTHPVVTEFLNDVTITIRGKYRHVESNGVPFHAVGQFPNRGNPNTIAPQHHQYRVPLHPKVAKKTTPMGRQAFGVGINGVPFHPGTAEFWGNDRRGWNYEAITGKIDLGLDDNLAHVQPTGSYHYHGVPVGLLELLEKTAPKKQMSLIGYAADGFPMYGPLAHEIPNDANSPLVKMTGSYETKKGTRPDGPGGAYDGRFQQDWEYVKGSGTLDECNGRDGVTPEYPKGTYYYVVTEDYPFIPRRFRGTPDPSFIERGPPPGGGPGGPGRLPPRGPFPPRRF